MKFSFASLALFLAAGAGSAAADLLDSDPVNIRAAPVYIQPVGAAGVAPAPLAEIRYDASDLSSAEVAAYEPPEVDEQDDSDSDSDGNSAPALYRIGLYDPKAGWLGATSVTAAATFAKGYRPHFVLTIGGKDTAGIAPSSVLGVAVRGLPIDAGQTRDFGPQATVVEAGAGVVPALNPPVVLDPAGQKAAPAEERTFLQKYWWAIGVALLMVLTSGGGAPEEEK